MKADGDLAQLPHRLRPAESLVIVPVGSTGKLTPGRGWTPLAARTDRWVHTVVDYVRQARQAGRQVAVLISYRLTTW
jgi:hypothetical protein